MDEKVPLFVLCNEDAPKESISVELKLTNAAKDRILELVHATGEHTIADLVLLALFACDQEYLRRAAARKSRPSN